jgi:hypothetical protein
MLSFNLNDINGIRQFNETNKPILCQYLGGKRMITFEVIVIFDDLNEVILIVRLVHYNRYKNGEFEYW